MGKTDDIDRADLQEKEYNDQSETNDRYELNRNRRLYPRLDKVFPVIINGITGTSYGIARNVSEGGMFLESIESQPVGSKIRITFIFPGSDAEITAEAEVRFAATMNYTGPRTGLPASTRGIGLKFIRFFDDTNRNEDELISHIPDIRNLH